MMREWPLLRGFISRIAMLFLFSSILYEGICSWVIEQKMHCWLWGCCSCCDIILFCFRNSSICCSFIDVICSLIWSLLSSGKFSNCFRSCCLICWVCSGVRGMILIWIRGLKVFRFAISPV